MPSPPSTRDWHLAVATVLVVSTLIVAGCTGSRDYTTTISEPETGDVIENVSVDTINQLDGARFDVDYALNATENDSTSLVVYKVRENGSLEVKNINGLSPTRYHTGFSVAPPQPDDPVRTYRVRVERGDTALDAVTITIGIEERS